jgi:hypothetical protein
MVYKKFNFIFKFIINSNLIFYSLIFFLFIIINYIFYIFFIDKYPDYIDADLNLILISLDHSFGDLIYNIIQLGKFSQKMFNFDIDFYLVKMPLGPYFLTFLYFFITKNFFLIILIKNLFFFSFLLFIGKIVLKKNLSVLFLLLLLAYNPFNLYNFLRVVPEEGYLNYLLVILFLVFNSNIKKRTIIISISLILLFFTKGSSCFFIYPLILYFFIYEKKKLPLISIIMCFFIWFSYAYIKTNKFISPISLSSVGGMTISTANNDEFNKIYPLQSPDILYPKVLKDNYHLTKNLTNEIDIDKVFKTYSINYILNNKIDFYKSILKKIDLIFFNFRKDAQNIQSSDYNQIRYSNIFNIIILYLTIILIFFKLLTNNFGKLEFFYIIFCLTYLFPFIIGILFTRNLVPVYLFSHLYIYFELLKKFKFYSLK